jgi:hypothetical protein
MVGKTYKQETNGPRTQVCIQHTMMEAMLKVREQHKNQLVKLLPIVDPSLGETSLPNSRFIGHM